MKEFQMPEIKVVVFNSLSDVITTSSYEPDPNGISNNTQDVGKNPLDSLF